MVLDNLGIEPRTFPMLRENYTTLRYVVRRWPIVDWSGDDLQTNCPCL